MKLLTKYFAEFLSLSVLLLFTFNFNFDEVDINNRFMFFFISLYFVMLILGKVRLIVEDGKNKEKIELLKREKEMLAHDKEFSENWIKRKAVKKIKEIDMERLSYLSVLTFLHDYIIKKDNVLNKKDLKEALEIYLTTDTMKQVETRNFNEVDYENLLDWLIL